MRIAFCTERGIVKRGDTAHIPSRIQDYHEFRTVASLFRALKVSTWDVVIVGWNLPGINGRDVLQRVRAMFPVIPRLVFLTEHAEAADIVYALENGAADYIIAPLPPAVLRARLDAHLRAQIVSRKSGDLPLTLPDDSDLDMQLGGYVFNQRRQYVDICGQRIYLRPKEYVLALLLFRSPGRVIARECLHEALWGTLKNFPSRALDVHICRLRNTLQRAQGNDAEIVQVRGVGYRVDLARACP
ncbi:response regulator transcription factor (plasmid) [Paraburkholderia sp. PREW-6R]|uniref:response regulator transcription factor n=1 Tax=Paraburkholderia sp. PREW-6R TaxID=3141544 RepID=UPI0031F5341D